MKKAEEQAEFLTKGYRIKLDVMRNNANVWKQDYHVDQAVNAWTIK